jgi:phage FluMu protein Com
MQGKFYRIETQCPRCKRKGETEAGVEHPTIHCGDCLMDDVEISQLTTKVVGTVMRRVTP